MKDLIIAVADGYQEKTMESLLARIPISSGTREFTFDIIKNPGKDSGSFNDSHELLRPFSNQYSYALVIFDFEGTGVEHLSREQIEDEVQRLLSNNGWSNRNCVIVIQPELENWIWIDNPNVAQALGWEKNQSLYEWAKQEGFLLPNSSKPERPKEALEKAMRISGTPPSASIYKRIAEKVSYRRCEDPAFKKLIQQIIAWFPIN